jgi:hypothetical protein
MYNVIDLADGSVKVWEMSAAPVRKVQKHYDRLADQDKALHDPGVAFVVSKKRKDSNFYEYDVVLVKDRDLEKDEITEATKRGLFTDSIVKVHTKAELREAVENLDD